MGKTECMEVRRHPAIMANENSTVGSNSYEKVKTFKYLGFSFANRNSTHEEIKCRLKSGNSCCYSVQTHLFSRLFSKNLKIRIYKAVILSICYMVMIRGLLH